MRNLVMSALVSLLVAVSVAGAVSLPVPAEGGRADNPVLKALQKKVTTLESNVNCFTGPILELTTIVTDQGTLYVQPTDVSDPNAVYLATVKARCVA